MTAVNSFITVACVGASSHPSPPITGAGPEATIYEIGDLAVLSVSPDLAPDEPLQIDPPSTPQKIQPRLSSEIKWNYVGTTPPRLPRTAESDLQPFLPFHLQDDDPETLWMSR